MSDIPVHGTVEPGFEGVRGFRADGVDPARQTLGLGDADRRARGAGTRVAARHP